MGRRHQLFVIARINGTYQCVAVVHHQWFCEEQPLRVAARFLKAYSNPFDYQSIKADLRQAANLQASGEALVCKDTLCPFIAYLLWGATVADEDCPASTELMPHDMGTTQGHNDEGITVLDITDPKTPAYCFVNVSGLGCTGPQPKILTPLTAEEYLRSYFPKTQDADHMDQRYVDAFKDFDVIGMDRLSEVWPDEYSVPPTDSTEVVDQDEAAIQDPPVDIASLSRLSLEVLYDTAGEWPPAEHVLEIGGRALAGHFDVSSGVFDIGDLKVTLRSLVCTADFLIAGHGRVGDLAYYLDMSRFQSDASLSASDMQSISDAFPNLKCINLIGFKQVTREVIDEHHTNNTFSPLLLNYAEFGTNIDFFSLIQAPMRTPARFTIIARAHERYHETTSMMAFGRPYLHIDAALASASRAVARFGAYLRLTGTVIAWTTSLYSGLENKLGERRYPSISFPARVVSSENADNAGWAFFLDVPEQFSTRNKKDLKYAFVNLDIPTEDQAGFTVDNFVEQTRSITRKSLRPTTRDVAHFKKALKDVRQLSATVMSVDEVESFRIAARQPREPPRRWS